MDTSIDFTKYPLNSKQYVGICKVIDENTFELLVSTDDLKDVQVRASFATANGDLIIGHTSGVQKIIIN